MAATKQPVIFISYSHLDEPDPLLNPGADQWLTYVTSHLKPAAAYGKLELWDDRRIDGGGDWRKEIDDALNRCAVCILLVSRHSLSSRFILDVEMKQMLLRHQAGGAHLYPIVITSVDLGAAPWLLALNLKPVNGTALELYEKGPRNKVMSDLAAEIRIIIERAAVIPSKGASPTGAASLPDPIDVSRLPDTPYKKLVGRQDELSQLDSAWADDKTNIVSLIAWGGAGKSALVNEWLTQLRADNYRNADAVIGWSFYSQGTKERATSAEGFLNWALETLGIRTATTSATAKGEKLAEALAERRILLLLDGVEPLQHGPDMQKGALKDQGLRAFLRRFAVMPPAASHGLVVVTSRLPIHDLQKFKADSAPVLDLGKLSDIAGAELLSDNGVHGSRTALREAGRAFDGHALALSLLASFLRELHGGDVSQRDRIRDLLIDRGDPGHDHAKRVMESYETEWLADQPVLRSIMLLVGLFDRPATGDCLRALRKKPAIVGLTDPIVALVDNNWNRAVTRLRDVHLLAPLDSSTPETLDAHPLVREWFGERLRGKNDLAWRSAHSRLYDHLRRTTKEGDEPTLEGLAPLYQAIRPRLPRRTLPGGSGCDLHGSHLQAQF